MFIQNLPKSSQTRTLSEAIYNSRVPKNNPYRVLRLSCSTVKNPIRALMRIGRREIFQFEDGIGVLDDMLGEN
jgi:hypothetical protein